MATENVIKFSSLVTKMKYVMGVVNRLCFVPHYISSGVYERCAFSDAHFDLKAYANETQTAQLSIDVEDLFVLELEPSETHRPALEFIKKCRDIFWDKEKSRESTLALKLCSEVLQYICRPDEIILESVTYGCLLLNSPINGVRADRIGLGSRQTWHGTPDIRVRGTNILLGEDESEDEPEDEPEDEAEDSDGMTVIFEMKSSLRASHLPQAVATCITSSFTEKNVHASMDPTVPTILMDGSKFRVILYNCIHDVLLISEYKDLCSDRGRLSSTGVAFLWLVINHRLFLRQLPDFSKNYPAKFKNAISRGSLKDFEKLSKKTLSWPKEKRPYFVENSELPFESISSPPRKKSKQAQPHS